MNLEIYKQKLLALKKELEENSINDVESFKDSIGELSLIDNHPADVGDELFERSKDLSIRDNNQFLLEKVNKALEKLSQGQYGKCDKCGKNIDVQRLDVLPYAAECKSCNQKHEKDYNNRPVEEEVLETPFNRSYTGRKGQIPYDGEDSWQDVARYGTSETGQDLEQQSKDMPYEHCHETRGYVDEVEQIVQEDNKGHLSTNKKSKK